MCIYKKHCQGPSIKCYVKFTKRISIFYSLMPTCTCTYFFNDFLRCVTTIVFFERKPDRKMNFCLGYWCLLVFIMTAFTYSIKIPLSLQQRPKTHSATESLFKIVQIFLNTFSIKNFTPQPKVHTLWREQNY